MSIADTYKKLDIVKDNYLQLNLTEVIDYEKFCMISIVWHSTKIEGCSLTEADTKILINDNLTAKGKPLQDHLMVKDHFDAFLFIQDQAKLKRKLSPEFIKEIGAFVMKNTGGIVNTISGNFDVSQGEFRKTQVYVDKKYFPDFNKIDGLINKLCRYVNEKIDDVDGYETIELSADLHYNFVNIHPFADGNGRTARLLMNYILLYHNQPLIKIFTEDRLHYIEALNKTEEKNNFDIFREFIAEQQIKFLEEEIKTYNKKDNHFFTF